MTTHTEQTRKQPIPIDFFHNPTGRFRLEAEQTAQARKEAFLMQTLKYFKQQAETSFKRLLNNTTVYKNREEVYKERDAIISHFQTAGCFGQPKVGEKLDEEALLIKKIRVDAPLLKRISKAAERACERLAL